MGSEINEEVRAELIKNVMQNVFTEYEENINNYTSILRSPNSTVDNIMYAKTYLLSCIVKYIPLNAGSCYYCQRHSNDCIKCEYAYSHGKCDPVKGERSVYVDIQEKKHDLCEVLRGYWLGGGAQEAQEADEKIKSKLHKNSLNIKECYDNIFVEYVAGLTGAREVKEIMAAKRKMLVSLIESLPLTTYHCYFCMALKPGDKCHNCLYKNLHGECGAIDSTFMKITHAKIELLKALHKY